eukprot:2726134-Amphidinium_carterae.1
MQIETSCIQLVGWGIRFHAGSHAGCETIDINAKRASMPPRSSIEKAAKQLPSTPAICDDWKKSFCIKSTFTWLFGCSLSLTSCHIRQVTQ